MKAAELPVSETEPTTSVMLDAVDRQLINLLQRGLPICSQAFVEIARILTLQATEVLARLQRLLDVGILSRFGPMFQIERAGGRFTLAAIAVPPERFDDITAIVNAFPEVAHNYQRTHHLNMWFVLATETPQQCAETIARIEQATGLQVVDMPKEREFRVQLFFDATLESERDNAGGDGLMAAPPHPSNTPLVLDTVDRTLMRATQAGLPVNVQPFAAVAQQLNATEDAIIERFLHWQQQGVLRRIAAVPNHYALGYVHNGMTVWDVDDAQVDCLGEQVAALGFVSHCYRRPRHLPTWPYNLFAMVHGRSRTHTDQQIQRIAAVLGSACRHQDVLWSTRILKKTGLRIND